MNTDDLIERMAQGLEPVTPLPSPGKRTAAWSLVAALYLGSLVLAMALINGVASASGTAFWLSQAAAIATGMLAGGAAFASVVPGIASRLSGWALAGAVVWLATLVATPPADAAWSAVAAAHHEWLCIGFIVIGGAPLAAGLAWMLRRGAPLSPATTAALAALAVATLANVGACLTLPHPNGAVTFAWHGGVVLALVVVAGLCGRVVFPWGTGRDRVR
jgi:hypothetical protein